METERHEGWLERAGRAMARGLGYPFRPAAAAAGTVRRHASRDAHGWGDERDERDAEDDRMRLVAVLLVLGSLLVWIVFVQG